MTMTLRYSLKDFTDITFNGFNINLPEETLLIITELSQQVGSPTYVKTPTFNKRENILKMGANDAISGTDFKRKKKRPVESLNDSDWETIRTFQTTKMEERVGIDVQIDMMRSWLNKMSDKMYNEPCERIMEILDNLVQEKTESEDMKRVGTIIFDIATNNRFYSKLYADLYSKLIDKYQVMRNIFNENLESFMELFNCIEYVDSEKDYDKFCKINKDNERRKALSMFFVNLTANNIISEDKLAELACGLLNKITELIVEENKKNEVDELAENVAILYSYNKQIYDLRNETFDGLNFGEMIEKLANSKAKTYPSLSNKSIFKFMDLVEM